MKRGVRVSKKPLKSSTLRDLRIFGLQVAHQSHMFPSIQDSEMICCNLLLWKEICTRLRLVLCFQHQGIREHLLDMQTREWAIRVL